MAAVYLDEADRSGRPRGVRPEPWRTADGPVALWRRFWDSCWTECGETAATRLARSQGFVATPRQLRPLGVTKNDLRRWVRRGRWWLPARGAASPIVIAGTTPQSERQRHALAAAAQTLTRETVAISGRSAAIVHGLPTVTIPPIAEVTAPPVPTTGRHGLSDVHRARTRGSDITEWYGVPVLTPERTLVDLGRHDRFDAIMAADAALRELCVDPDLVRTALEQAVGWPGVRQARAVLALADPRAESPLESVLRLRLHEDGFPVPELQYRVVDTLHATIYYVDLLLPDQRLVLEADGRGKYADDALWEEKVRETRLRALGFRVERVIWSDVFRDWPATSARLRHLIDSA
jgi:very-short-patch-repair endonuclease